MKGDIENFEIPPSPSSKWYERLNALARKYGVKRVAILDQALKLYEKHHKSDEEQRKESGEYSRKWWQSLTPEQKAEESKKRSKAARARWDKKP